MGTENDACNGSSNWLIMEKILKSIMKEQVLQRKN